MSTTWNRRTFLESFAILAAPAAAASGGATQTLISFRIGTAHWLTDKRFQGLLDFFARSPGTADELAFFTSETHPPLPLAVMQRRAERLSELLPRVRQRGMRAGINVLSTVGHHEENLPNSLAEPWQRMTDIHGKECRGSFCPAQPELIDYARKIYTAMAQAGPDFLWIDDDVRLAGHKPVNFGCFCPLCLRHFSSETGRAFTREQLAQAFDSGSLDERLGWRRKWLEHNRSLIDNLFREIEQAAHAVKPGLPLGFMTGDRFYEGYAFERWARTLAGPGQAPVWWRPGGGFYSDETLPQLIDKANALGRQVAALPAAVVNIQSELENFPYQRLRKSEQAAAVEAGTYMAAGTTGTAFNVLTMHPDSLDEYVPLLNRIAACRPFYQDLQHALGRGITAGVWPAWNADLMVTANPDGPWLASGRMPLSEPYTLGEIGIPICYDVRGRKATALSRAAALAFTKDELRTIFSGGVLMDVDAWQTMERLGLAAWTGVRSVKGVDVDALETLSNHPLNGKYAGFSRDCRQSFWWERAYVLEPASAEGNVLARIHDYGDRDFGPCMSTFRNELGGRVVVMGYYPWSQIHSTAKSTQLKNVCDWLASGQLPALIESFHRIALWHRRDANGKGRTVLLNASLDPAAAVTLRLATSSTRFTLEDMKAQKAPVTSTPGPQPGQMRLRLPRLAPWNLYLIEEA